MIYNTGETSEELRQRYNPEGSTLRRAQLRMVDMLVYLDRIFRENNIEYMLSFGNVLGCLRHEGQFIPWDDDLDVVVLRRDFKKAQQVILDNPHPQYVLQNHDTDPGYMGMWAILRDTKSEYHKKDVNHNIRKYRGLQIDIFPFDENIPYFVRYCASQFRAKILDNLIRLKWFRLANITFSILTKGIFPVIIRHYSGEKAKRINPTLGFGYFKDYDCNMLFPPKPIMFEGHKFLGPAKPEEYLRATYGDYMKLSPESERHHHEAEYEIWE